MTARTPHVHAEVIHAFADGHQIEHFSCGNWNHIENPCFIESEKYRVKPSKIYPVTTMPRDELYCIWRSHDGQYSESCEAAANAALKHACDAGEILTLAEHQAAIILFGERLRDAAILRDKDRDIAIAEAVRKACHGSTIMQTITSARDSMCVLDLAAIIATVPA